MVWLLIAVCLVCGGGEEESPRPLTDDGLEVIRPVWTPDGRRVLYARQEADGAHIALYWLDAEHPGEPRRLTARELPEYHGAVSPDGTRVLFVAISQSGTQGNLDLASIAVGGTEVAGVVGDQEGRLSHQDWPAWAPDGKRFAFSSTHEGNQEIYLAEPDGRNLQRLTQSPGHDAHPCFAADGETVLFATDRWGGLELASIRVDGTGLERLTESPGLDDYPAVSPDGRRVAFVSHRDGQFEVYLLDRATGALRNLTASPGRDLFPAWHPDGRSLVIVSDRGGAPELYRIAVSP
jgi:TolB protein